MDHEHEFPGLTQEPPDDGVSELVHIKFVGTKGILAGQAVCYTLSFYVTWPIVFCVYFGELDNKK